MGGCAYYNSLLHIRFYFEFKAKNTVCFLPCLKNYVFIIKLFWKLVDKEKIKKCISGDLTGFPEMVEKLAPYAFSIALKMLGNEDEADDIVQESLISVWLKIGRLKKAEGFKSWFYRIVLNKCYDRIRSRGK